MQHTNSNTSQQNIPAISTIDGEARIRDTDLAESLGFDRPRDIRKIIARYKANLLKFGLCATVAQRPEGGGPTATEYWLNKQQALFVTTKSDAPTAIDMTVELIRRFDAYERGAIPVPAAPLTREQRVAEAFLLSQEIITEQKAVIEQLTAVNADLQVDKEAFDRIANADGLVNLTTAAKIISQPPQKTIAAASSARLIYKRAGQRNWTAYQTAIAQGLLAHKVHVEVHPDGTEKVREQVMVTPKGLAKLAKLTGGQLPPEVASGRLL